MNMKTLLQKLALGYAFLFLGVFLMNYIPFIHDAEGKMFGLFKLDWRGNALHLASAVWAFSAALCSERASIFYFKWFGTAYLFDGFLGFFYGCGYLDGGIWLRTNCPTTTFAKIATNIPHILIGGLAMIIGFHLVKRLKAKY